ncbi:MAG: hypothetical protein KGL53_01060, partial [Elusimicrobia bacterium]|nr:hypothetical protein [Elusimicrobiota bacterium]
LPEAVTAREHAAKSLELFRPLYRQGRQSVLEVLRAEDALAQSQLAVIDILERLDEGWAGLTAAAGGLDEASLVELRRSLEEKR